MLPETAECDSIKLNRKRSKGSGVRGCAATFYGDYDKQLCVSSFEGATIGRALLRKSLQNKPEPWLLNPRCGATK